jgi:hypothetical protein
MERTIRGWRNLGAHLRAVPQPTAPVVRTTMAIAFSNYDAVTGLARQTESDVATRLLGDHLSLGGVVLTAGTGVVLYNDAKLSASELRQVGLKSCATVIAPPSRSTLGRLIGA